jgi:hypothetical protein
LIRSIPITEVRKYLMNIAEMKEQVGEEEESVSEDQIVLS